MPFGVSLYTTIIHLIFVQDQMMLLNAEVLVRAIRKVFFVFFINPFAKNVTMLHITWIINTFAAHSVMLFLLLLDFSLSRSVTLRVVL